MKKMICILLLATLMFSTSFSAFANFSAEARIDEKEFLTSYFETRGNLLEKKDYNSLNELEKYFYDSKNNIYYEYEKNRLEYFITAHNVDGTNNGFSSVELEIIKSSKVHDTIEIEVNVKENFKFFSIANVHKILLKYNNSSYKILEDEYADEFKNLHGFKTDFNKEIDKVKKFEQDREQKTYVNPQDVINNTPTERGIFYDYFSSSEKTAAVSYATTYTDNTGTTSTANYNNNQFKSYGSNDCQNFVSQAIWYGMGGRSSANKDLPMYDDWWANTSGETSTWNWTGTSYFKNEVINNYNNSDFGLQGYEVSRSSLQKGDYIYVTGHVMLVTDIIDSNSDGTIDYNEIYFSAHTNNRLNSNLSGHYSESSVTYIRILRLKWISGI